LDEAAPVHALLLSRQDGHLCLANSEALRRAGIDGETTNPPGGRIERDASGAATGVLSEAALYLAWNVMMAEMTADDFREPLLRGCKAALSAGMTSVHAVLLENVAAELETLRALDEQGALPLRVYVIVPVESLGSLSRETVAWEGRRGRMGAAKIFTDGTLFAGTAALRAPYADAARSTGETTHSTNALHDLVQQTRDAGLQPAVHAVGDRAVEEVLDAFEAVYGTEESVKARPRIEHATVLAPDLIRRMSALGVVASLQPRRRAQLETRLGQARAAWVNPWRALVDVGVNVAASSDAPFLQNQPGSWAAVVDATRKGLTIEEALRVTAQGAAYASFQETELGVLRPGMLADVTVLSKDPRGRPPEELRDIRPVLVVIGGAVSWDASAR
jgi:predicted amidohydrolase YtcJ